MLESLLLLLHAVVAVFLIVLVLLQRSDGGIGSLGGGGSSGLMSSSGAANGMTKATAILATIFMVSSIALAMQAAGGSKQLSVTDKVATDGAAVPAMPEPMVPEVPVQ